ncbi:MAG: hypothetical protein LBB85_11105, partial [Dysgonamonadaceae bacterium]|nr:hypothetical protein [Dysgonamonadaceae bacterium]
TCADTSILLIVENKPSIDRRSNFLRPIFFLSFVKRKDSIKNNYKQTYKNHVKFIGEMYSKKINSTLKKDLTTKAYFFLAFQEKRAEVKNSIFCISQHFCAYLQHFL